MRMQRFRVQNYKKIEDTGWIECNDTTVFVGKNEAGKSALFRGLSKINPSDGKTYDGLKEFPRRRYTSEFRQDLPVCSVEFKLDNDDIGKLTEVCPTLKNILQVKVTRYYSNNRIVEFESKANIKSTSVESYRNSLDKWKTKIERMSAPDGSGEKLSQIKNTIQQSIATARANLQSSNDHVDVSTPQQVDEILSSTLNEKWEQNLFKEIVEENSKFLEIIKAVEWILKNMPQYIYFDKYDVIDSAIHVDEFIRKINKDPDNPRLRTTKCLFQHVDLDVEKIRDLNPNKEDISVSRRLADERHTNMSSASAVMTQKFADWWDQRKHKFRYQIDGQFFRVWVADDLDPSEIELDQRSAGMQYFFSFYLVFLVESRELHANSILLLDEPGLHYHGTAQKKIRPYA